MSIPILHHNFDATGLELFYKSPFYALSIIILIIILLLILLIFFKLILTLKEKNKISPLSFITYLSLTSLAFFWTMQIGGSAIVDAPKFFSSDKDSGTILKPVESLDDLPEDGILSGLGLIRKYSEDNTLLSRYNGKFVKEMKNNEKMKKYTIPECELNDNKSIICGGNDLISVQANKGDKTVTLTPHVEIEYDKAEIDVDNPKDKGVQVYYWIEETE